MSATDWKLPYSLFRLRNNGNLTLCCVRKAHNIVKAAVGAKRLKRCSFDHKTVTAAETHQGAWGFGWGAWGSDWGAWGFGWGAGGCVWPRVQQP